MAVKYADGKHALGLCDMCQQQYKLHELIPEIYNQKPTGYLVCSECWDLDNPQLQLGRFPINDPQALLKPRPDLNVLDSRELWGWAPVGNPSTRANGCSGVVHVNGLFAPPVRA